MPAHQETSLGHEVDAERVDAHYARLLHQHGAAELVAVHSHRDEARVAAACGRLALDDLHAAPRRDEPCVDGVDAVLGEVLHHALDRCGDQEVGAVLRELALEVELDDARAPAEELRVQRRESLRQVRERPQVRELLRRQRRRIDRVTRQLSRQHRRHLLGDVEGDGGLRLGG